MIKKRKRKRERGREREREREGGREKGTYQSKAIEVTKIKNRE